MPLVIDIYHLGIGSESVVRANSPGSMTRVMRSPLAVKMVLLITTSHSTSVAPEIVSEQVDYSRVSDSARWAGLKRMCLMVME